MKKMLVVFGFMGMALLQSQTIHANVLGDIVDGLTLNGVNPCDNLKIFFYSDDNWKSWDYEGHKTMHGTCETDAYGELFMRQNVTKGVMVKLNFKKITQYTTSMTGNSGLGGATISNTCTVTVKQNACALAAGDIKVSTSQGCPSNLSVEIKKGGYMKAIGQVTLTFPAFRQEPLPATPGGSSLGSTQ